MEDLKLKKSWEKGLFKDHARVEQLKYLSYSEDKLITELASGNYGEHYMIWLAIKLKGTPNMIEPLFEVVKSFNSRNDFLKRFHSTDALFHLLELEDQNLENKITGNIMLFDKLVFSKAIEKLGKIITKRRLTINNEK